MVMDYKKLEGRVFHLEIPELPQETLEKLIGLDCVESVEHHHYADCCGVTYFYRLVLKEAVPLLAWKKEKPESPVPKEIRELIPPNVDLSQQMNPAVLLGHYYGSLTTRSFSLDEALTNEQIARIEEIPLVLYIQDVSFKDWHQYFIGFKVEEHELRGFTIEDEIKKAVGHNIYLQTPEGTELATA
jgi:hypothetical protein